ncbi:MAG TPA: hypothetical protein VLK84_19910 [Longimicrobium sp.]|nr:hypothetical protein [Longimicrobium sp.]
MSDNDRETKQYSLKEREYRGADGQIHHHTNVWMEQHEGESGGESESGSRGGSGKRSASGGRSGSTGQGGSRASGSRKSGGGRGSSSRSQSGSRGGSGREEETGDEEETGREGGGMGRVMVAAGVVAMATAAFMVGRRLRAGLDAGDRSRHDRQERPDLRVVRDDDDNRTGDGMY